MLGDLPVPMLLLSLLVYASALERVAPGMQMDAMENKDMEFSEGLFFFRKTLMSFWVMILK